MKAVLILALVFQCSSALAQTDVVDDVDEPISTDDSSPRVDTDGDSAASVYRRLPPEQQQRFEADLKRLQARRERTNRRYDTLAADIETLAASSEVARETADALSNIVGALSINMDRCTKVETEFYTLAANPSTLKPVLDFMEDEVNLCYQDLSEDNDGILEMRRDVEIALRDADETGELARQYGQAIQYTYESLNRTEADIRRLKEMGVPN